MNPSDSISIHLDTRSYPNLNSTHLMKSSRFSSFKANGMNMYRKDARAKERTIDLLALSASSKYHHMMIIFENTASEENIVPDMKNLPILNFHHATFISLM